MTLAEAIRVHTVLQGAPVLKDDRRIIDALELGIEALKRIEEGRSKGYDYFGHLLPGETEE